MPKIRSITLYAARIPLVDPFIISLGMLDHAENVVVRIEADALTGFGECSPFRTIHGETQAGCMSVGKEIAKVLLGADASNPVDCLSRMDKLIYGNACIKSAFDMAIHDLAAQAAGLPLWQYLGGKAGEELFTDYTVSIGPVDRMVKDAVSIRERGFPVVKVKLGEHAAADIQRMRAIRAAIGNDLPIRIDANQGWTKSDAIEALQQMESLNIQHCEEPVSRRAFFELPEIRKNAPIPIMADESCCDEYDAQNLLALQAVDSFNIKLSKSSGLIRARRIAVLAEQAGMRLQLGGFLESRLGFTAAAHFAWTLQETPYVDFDTPLMLSADPVDGGMQYGPGGRIRLPEGLGLGAAVDAAFLQSCPREEVR
jgi:L-alanine-DL-glutamate epimerase-like enolase superfamily enzyme